MSSTKPICTPKPYKVPTTCCNNFGNPLNRASVVPNYVPTCNKFANPADKADATARLCCCLKYI